MASSNPARAAVAMANAANRRLAQASRCLYQTKPCISASVRHAEAVMDQMTVTQLIECYQVAWQTIRPPSNHKLQWPGVPRHSNAVATGQPARDCPPVFAVRTG